MTDKIPIEGLTTSEFVRWLELAGTVRQQGPIAAGKPSAVSPRFANLIIRRNWR